jgi:hypothetical protein
VCDAIGVTPVARARRWGREGLQLDVYVCVSESAVKGSAGIWEYPLQCWLDAPVLGCELPLQLQCQWVLECDGHILGAIALITAWCVMGCWGHTLGGSGCCLGPGDRLHSGR